MTIEPLVTDLWARAAVIFAAYALTLGLSGVLVRFIVLPRGMKAPKPPPDGPRFDTSTVIGKCENIIAVTFVLLGQETGLALIFAAKSLVRSDQIKENPGFFLGGTLVNLVWALIVAVSARAIAFGIG